MAVRTAILNRVSLDRNGNVVKKNDDATISQVANSTADFRVYAYQTGSAPNAADSNTEKPPTIHEYLNLEAAAGYELVHLDQTFIITSDGTP